MRPARPRSPTARVFKQRQTSLWLRSQMTSIVMHYALPGARGKTRHFNYCALLDGDVRREAAHTDPVYSTHVRGLGFAVASPPHLRCLTSPHLTGAGMGGAGLGSSFLSHTAIIYKKNPKKQTKQTRQHRQGDITVADVRSSSVHTRHPITLPCNLLSPPVVHRV